MDAPKPLITDKKAVQDVAGEYRYLMERLKEDRGEAWQKYRNTFWQAYFESSMMLYEKLSGDLKPLLSRRMQEDLRNAIRRKECSEKNFDVRYKEQMGLLLKSVTEFDESIQDVLSEQQKRRTEYLAKQDGMGSRIAVKDDGSKFRVRNKAGIRIEKEMFSAETRKAADTTQSSRINRHWLLNEMSRDLAALRMLIGFSADEMGDMLGMSKSMYKSIESGKREISWDQFMALLFIFRYNERTSAVVDTLGLYPEPLKLRLQKGIISG